MRVLNVGSPIPRPQEAIVPWLGSRLALVASRGLDLGIADVAPVPLERLQAVAVGVSTLQGAPVLGVLLVFEGFARPLLVEASKTDSKTFGLPCPPQDEDKVRQATLWLARNLPRLILDDATVGFLKGQPPRAVGERLADLAGVLSEASRRAAGAAPAPAAPAPAAPAPAAPAPAAPPPPPPAPAASSADPPSEEMSEQAPLPAAEEPDEPPIPEEWQYRPPPYWRDEGTGSLVYVSARELHSAKTKEHDVLLDLENNDYDPRLVSGLKTTTVALDDIQVVARDETLGHVEVLYRDGPQTKRVNVRHSTEDTGEKLLDLLQEKLGDRWQRRIAPRPRTRAASKLVLFLVLFTVPWSLWYLKALADEKEVAERFSESEDFTPERFVEGLAARWVRRETTQFIMGTGTGVVLLIFAVGAYRVSIASSEVVELARIGRPSRRSTSSKASDPAAPRPGPPPSGNV